jgi:hypothetical protein
MGNMLLSFNNVSCLSFFFLVAFVIFIFGFHHQEIVKQTAQLAMRLR